MMSLPVQKLIFKPEVIAQYIFRSIFQCDVTSNLRILYFFHQKWHQNFFSSCNFICTLFECNFVAASYLQRSTRGFRDGDLRDDNRAVHKRDLAAVDSRYDRSARSFLRLRRSALRNLYGLHYEQSHNIGSHGPIGGYVPRLHTAVDGRVAVLFFHEGQGNDQRSCR